MSKKIFLFLRERENIREEVGGAEEEASLMETPRRKRQKCDVKERHATRGRYRPCDRIRVGEIKNRTRILKKRDLNHQL